MTDSVRVTCPKCQVSAPVPASRAGHALRCSRCGTTFRYGESSRPNAGHSRKKVYAIGGWGFDRPQGGWEAIDLKVGGGAKDFGRRLPRPHLSSAV